MHKTISIGLVAASLIIGIACTNTKASVDDEAGSDSDPNALNELAAQTLGEHLSVPKASVNVLRVSAVSWPDGSFGCPQPGMNYPQVITPGHYAVLKHDGRVYRVHIARGQAFVCETGSGGAGKPPPVPLLRLPQERLIALARADLAGRLSVEPDQITMQTIRKIDWTDTSLGCPEEGEEYVSVVTQGYVLTMEYDGRQFAYHADQHRVLPCPPIDVE